MTRRAPGTPRQVDSKTQAYLDDFIKRKKAMLAAAKNVTLTRAMIELLRVRPFVI